MGAFRAVAARGLGQGGTADWTPLAQDAGARYGVDPALVLAVIQTESSGDPSATGRAGEVGLMQIMPSTAGQYGVSAAALQDPAVNVDTGTRYLADQLARYGGDVPSAVSAYNAGHATTKNQSYVQTVLGWLESFAGLAPQSSPAPTNGGGGSNGPVAAALGHPWTWVLVVAAVLLLARKR